MTKYRRNYRLFLVGGSPQDGFQFANRPVKKEIARIVMDLHVRRNIRKKV